VLRLIRTTSSLAVLAAVAIFALAGGTVAWVLRDEPARPAGLSTMEHVRAGAMLSVHAHVRDGYGDIDSDGRADCWIEQRADPDRYLAPKLSVWRGCTGEPVTFEWGDGMTVLAVPPALASPVWLRWIAEQIVGRAAVSCLGVAGCPAPGQNWPAWQWVLESAQRFAAQPGHHGTVAPRWTTGPRIAGGALVLPAVPGGWMQRLRGAEEPEPATSLAGARIILDLGGGPTLPGIPCAGLTVHAEAGGIVGTDANGRWTWLFRGLADYRGFAAKRLLCRDGLAIATTGGNFADVVAVDPATGGWLYDRSSDCCPGAELAPTFDGASLWARDYGTIVPLRRLGEWLAQPAARRPSLIDISKANRPELAHDGAMSANHIGRDHPAGELYEPFAPATVDRATRATLGKTLSCAGQRISWSPTAVLAERGQARWLTMEHRGSTRRIERVTCAGRRITIAYVRGNDLLEEIEPKLAREAIEVDLDRRRWRVKQARE
jgi:hypothetical protein